MLSEAYVALRPTSKKGYASRLEYLRSQHGHRTVSGLSREAHYHEVSFNRLRVDQVRVTMTTQNASLLC